MDTQKTIAAPVTLQGAGLHTAHKATMTFKPGAPDTGIVFVRTDLPGAPAVRAGIDTILASSRTLRRTSIGKHGAEVHTIEHLMAALSGLGIDNLVVEIDNQEVPGMDGSSTLFADSLQKTGIVDQGVARKYVEIKEPICVSENGASITALPAPDFRVSYTLSYNHPMLKGQYLETVITPDTFMKEISPARTFCLEQEAQELQRQGVGCGANYENTLVVGEHGVLRNKLRFPDEFVRHKVLDLLGDLYVYGMRIKGHIVALKSGHSLNLSFLQKLSERSGAKSLAAPLAAIPQKLEPGTFLDINVIKQILPHREPFLFVDRITEMEVGKYAVGLKNVTINDYFFKGHFPERPVMPGVLMVEAMAQVGGVMMLAAPENRGKLAFFMSVDKVKFRKTVVPGDQLIFQVTAGKIKSKTGQVFGKALVDGKVVCEAELMFALVE